jgi:DNA-directed RNA polymerase specialized sigma24 family protein
LDSDIEKSAEKYSHVHAVLIKMFLSADFQNAEDLADETIDRVVEKIESLPENYEGDKIRYFFGVANYIKKENFRKKTKQPVEMELHNNLGFSEEFEDEELPDNKLECLKKCLKKLNAQDRKLVLEYYSAADSRKKIADHKKIAKFFSRNVNALRVQVFRIRKRLEKCVKNCSEKGNSM